MFLFSEAGTEETAASVVMLFVRIAKRMPSVRILFFLASIPSKLFMIACASSFVLSATRAERWQRR